MLNKNGQRELAYLVIVDAIEPIEGKDRVECARVGGWTIMVRKGLFKPGDIGIYFEVDSKVPSTEPFKFLEPKKFRIKTQKYGKFYSQGLLMHPSDFDWNVGTEFIDDNILTTFIYDDEGDAHYLDDESKFLTQKLGVTYYVAEDNERKAPKVDKYKRMTQRLGAKANTPTYKWLYKRSWGKKLLFLLYGNKRADGGMLWPSHICAKTDVDRLQNMMWLLEDKHPYVASEKVDGSSCTIAVERKRFGRLQYYVCSRNVVFNASTDSCYYDSNIYFEAFEKYGLKEKITQILNDYQLNNVALQMEIYGSDVQKRDYSITDHQIAVFHIVSNRNKMPMDKVVEICEKYDIPHVPIVDDNYVFPDTIEEVQEFVEGAPSKLDGKPREGIVFYDKATGQTYTKFVSPAYLMKYH